MARVGARAALGGLTLRGRAFLAAGLTTLVCAVLLGQSPLVRIGVLLCAVPLLALLSLARSRHQLGVKRTLSPESLPAGGTGQVDLVVREVGPRIGGSLLLQEGLPEALGTAPRFQLDSTGSRRPRAFRYTVNPGLRGCYTLGPVTAVVADPFGLAELRRTFPETRVLTVTPRVHLLDSIPVPSGPTGSGDSRPRSFSGGTPEDVTIREYRPGDDLRRVHWRTSARMGELMVRREEEPWQVNATVLLDTRATAHRGHGGGSSFERAVEVAASLVLYLSGQGFAVRLVDADGGPLGDVGIHRSGAPGGADARRADQHRMLERLAVVQPGAGRHLTPPHAPGDSGLTVAVLGATGQEDLLALRELRGRASGTLAVNLDVAAWGRVPPRHREDAVAALATEGWLACRLGPGDDVASVWRDLGRREPTTAPHARAGGSA